VELVLAGHGRPVRGAKALAQANRRAVSERLERIRAALAGGPRPAFELVPAMLYSERLGEMMVGWGLTEALCYLRHLELRGVVCKLEESETERGALA
jgi:hypothetical protein